MTSATNRLPKVNIMGDRWPISGTVFTIESAGSRTYSLMTDHRVGDSMVGITGIPVVAAVVEAILLTREP